MTNVFRKLFGGIDLTWPKLIIAAVIAGVVTALIAMTPALKYTSFIGITTTLEVWILFGIMIIMNSKSPVDSAAKCFVFFLISQPLVYLIQVPFSSMGWALFGFYKYWFIWTILCIPMGFVGYYMKQDKWWGLLILAPMILLTAYSYLKYFSDFQFSYPRYILLSLFCAAAMILYPIAVFRDKKIQTIGAALGACGVIVCTVICLLNKPVYSADLMSNNENHRFDDTYTVAFDDPKYGDVAVVYIKQFEDYVIHADFRHAGDTVMTITAPNGEKMEYDIHIERDTYKVNRK